MPLFKKQTVKEKHLSYLQGDFSKLNRSERKIFELASACMNTQIEQNESSSSNCTNQSHTSDMPYADLNELQSCAEDASLSEDQTNCIDMSTVPPPCRLGDQHFQNKHTLPPPIHRQTYRMWKAAMDLTFRFWRLRKRQSIYIQPLDTFPSFVNELSWQELDESNQFFQLLSEFMGIFFSGMNVHVLPSVNMEEAGWSITTRNHKITGKKQYLASDVNCSLGKHMPKDGFCMLGISWTDLYPQEDLNFVLGEAAVKYNSATFCFGNYEPKSYVDGQEPITEIDGTILWRMIKVITHETCHIFGLSHCVFFHCAMNESTSLRQALSQPLFLCPICLRKIHRVCKFSIKDRYEALQEFLEKLHSKYPSIYAENGLAWLKQIILFLDENSCGMSDSR